MLTSLAIIFLSGLLLGSIFHLLKLPSLLGMILTGFLLGPYALNLIDPSILGISADLRKLALVIILTRAGLALDIQDLKKVGRPAILMCFVPSCLEIIGFILLAPPLLGVTIAEAAVMGAVIAAVSPAVVVPRMLKLMESGHGKTNRIPQLILAGASVDNIFVIVLFTSLIGFAQGEKLSFAAFAKIPVSIATGVFMGILCGIALSVFFQKIHMRDSVKVLLLLSVSFLLLAVENKLNGKLPFSGLIAIITAAATVLKKNGILAKRLSGKYAKLWVAAEILLFVLVGASVDFHSVLSAGLVAVLLIFGALMFRMLGVLLCLVATKLNRKERLFCMLAYLPKATVQAAIGSIPLSMGLPCGQVVLTLAVLSILITAPLGALTVDFTYDKLLTRNETRK